MSKHVHLVLRLGLAFVFGWMGIDKFLNVSAWYGWVPEFLTFLPQDPFLYVVGVVEVVLALLLLAGRFVRFAALACAVLMGGIVLSFGLNDATIRDIGLIAMAIALALMPERKYYELHKLRGRKSKR